MPFLRSSGTGFGAERLKVQGMTDVFFLFQEAVGIPQTKRPLEPGGVWSDLLGLMMVCSSCIQEIMEWDELENLGDFVLQIEIEIVDSCTLRGTCFKAG